MNIPDNYKVGFFQGGATQQFAMVPLNFMTTGKADYIVTGNFSNLAAKEAVMMASNHLLRWLISITLWPLSPYSSSSA